MTPTTNTPMTPLDRLQSALDAARRGEMPLAELTRLWRAQVPLLGGLPPRYATVLDQLLMPVESGSLFTEESCSFSQHDLLQALEQWLTQARSVLSARTGPST